MGLTHKASGGVKIGVSEIYVVKGRRANFTKLSVLMYHILKK